MAHLVIDLDRVVPFMQEYPNLRLFSRRAGGAGILEHPTFSGVRSLTIPSGQPSITVDIPPSSDYFATQEYMLAIGGREYVFVMPDENPDVTPDEYPRLSNLLIRGSSRLPPVLIQETAPIDPVVGDLWIAKSTHQLKYWTGSVGQQSGRWQLIGSAQGVTEDELEHIRSIVDDAVQLGSIGINGRTITFADDSGDPPANVYIPGISVYASGTLQGTANVVTQLNFVIGSAFGVSIAAERATITIPRGGAVDNATIDARVALKTDPLETRVDQIEDFEETFRVRTEVCVRQRIVISRTNTAYAITSSVDVPTDKQGSEVEITIEASAIPDGEAVFDLTDYLAKTPIVRSGTEMNALNSVLITNPPDNNQYWSGRDTSGDWFIGSNTVETLFVTIAVTELKDTGLGAGAVREQVKGQIEAGTDISVTPSGSGAAQRLRIAYTGDHSTPNAVTLDTSGFDNADDGTFPSWNNGATRWDAGEFADSDDIEFEYDTTNAEWSAKPKEKLAEIINAFQDGGWENVNGSAAQVPFVSSVSYSTEPTAITGHTFAIEGRNNTGFSNYRWLVVRYPNDLGYKTTRYRLAIYSTDSAEGILRTIDMDDSSQVSLLGTDNDYTYMNVGASIGIGGQELFRMQVLNEFTFNKSRLDLTTDELSDFIPRSEHIAANDGKDVVYNHAEDSFEFRTTQKIPLPNLPFWIGTSTEFAALTREDGVIYLTTD